MVFKSGILNEPAREELIAKFGGVKIKDLTLIDGKAVILPLKVASSLAKETGVLRIDNDIIVTTQTQILPWGINRIDAEQVWLSGNSADPIKVGIIDTGISNSHPDLKTN